MNWIKKNAAERIESQQKLIDFHKLQLDVADDDAMIYSKAVDELEVKVANIELTISLLQQNTPPINASSNINQHFPPTPPSTG